VNVARLGQRILEVAATRALDFEVVMPAHDAELVVRFVGAEPTADRTALRNRHTLAWPAQPRLGVHRLLRRRGADLQMQVWLEVGI
jgi:hypothetical protein